MKTVSRYRLPWWLVYWFLAGCILVNVFALVQSPLSMTIVFVIVQVIPLLLGGAFILWIILLFIDKADLGVWLTFRKYVLYLLSLLLLGLLPTLFVYGSAVWVAERTIQTVESKYGVEVNVLRKGTGWYYDDDEWGLGLNGTWTLTANVKTDNPKQLMMQLASDLGKHGWEGGAVTETHYGFQCSNLTAPRLPSWGVLFSNTNVFHISLPEDDEMEVIDEIEINLSFDAFNPFSSRCRL